MERRIVWLFVGLGAIIGGMVPAAWGGSSIGLASLGLGTVGGLAGLWFAIRVLG